MLENFTTFLKKKGKKEPSDKSKNAAKERLHLVLMQDRANVSADFLEMMKMEIVDVIKKYIDVDETDMDVKLENRVNEDGTSGAPALYANIPIVGINEEKKKESNEITKAKQVEQEQEQEQKEDEGKVGEKVEAKVEEKVEAKVEEKAEAKVEEKVEAKKIVNKTKTPAKKSVSVKKSTENKEEKTKKVTAKRGRKPKAEKENIEKVEKAEKTTQKKVEDKV